MSMENPDSPEAEKSDKAEVTGQTNIVTAALTRKQPPPESRQELKTRRWIIFCFWAVVAFFGLPVWYATTTVPRASLPLDSMNQWAEGQVSLCQREIY